MRKFHEKTEGLFVNDADLELLRLVYEGLQNQEIASRMHLSLSHVEKKLSNTDPTRSIYAKIGVRRRAEAIAWYERTIIREQAPRFRQPSQPVVSTNLSPTQEHAFPPIATRALAPLPETFLFSPNPYFAGTHLLIQADELAERRLWAQALPLYQQAEALLGPASSQVARAVCIRATLFIELGDYLSATTELQRAHDRYAAMMDDETVVKFYGAQGWLAYYLGDFVNAAMWFHQALDRAEPLNQPYLTETAHHFLGRVYTALGQTAATKKQATQWFRKGVQALEQAEADHRLCAWEDSLAYDRFRKAQLMRAQGNWREAQQLRTEARQFFGTDLAVLQVDLEEAMVALHQGETRTPQQVADNALAGWAQIQHAKGIADALIVLARAQRIQGHLMLALEYYIAALCVYPFSQNLDITRIWAEVATIIRQESKTVTPLWLQRLQARAMERVQIFTTINVLAVDRSVDITMVFNELYKLVQKRG